MASLLGRQTPAPMSISAIFFAVLISIGFLPNISIVGCSVAMTYGSEISSPHSNMVALIIILLVALLTLVFFIAGYIASRISHSLILFDSIMHGLATWATMAVLLVLLVSVATMTEDIRKSLNGISLKGARLVTDVQVFKGRAITTFEPKAHRKGPNIPTLVDKKDAGILCFAWWICFASLILGFGASMAAAILVHRGRLHTGKFRTRDSPGG